MGKVGHVGPDGDGHKWPDSRHTLKGRADRLADGPSASCEEKNQRWLLGFWPEFKWMHGMATVCLLNQTRPAEGHAREQKFRVFYLRIKFQNW